MKRNFIEWLGTFKDNISDYKYYINFEKVYKNVEENKVEFNMLNSLLGSKNIEEDFINLVTKYPDVLKCIPILLAVRNMEIPAMDEEGAFIYNFKKINQNLEQYIVFMNKTGLFDLLANRGVTNIIDFVLGVETGLDSNGRKNRGGTAFEDACEPVIKKICDKYNVTMLSQKQFKKLKEYGFSISEDIANRKADFILIKDSKALNIEVDYFFRGGSKPEEIIDSYINRQHDLDKLNMGFVLLTDGLCWDNKSKNQLQKGFRNMNYLMNFYLAKNGMLEEVIQTYFK